MIIIIICKSYETYRYITYVIYNYSRNKKMIGPAFNVVRTVYNTTNSTQKFLQHTYDAQTHLLASYFQ